MTAQAFGALNLRVVYGDLDLTQYPFSFSFGSDMGSPQTATDAYALLLQDGEVEVSTRASNRTMTFTVNIEGSDLAALAAAEAALVAEGDKARNVLSVDPGDGWAAPTMFETFRAQIDWSRDDNAERAGIRQFQVSFKAKPFGMSVDPVTAPAVGGGSATMPTVVTINDGSSLPGWSIAKGTLVDKGSYLATSGNSGPVVRYTAGSPVNLSTLPYVSVVLFQTLSSGQAAAVGGPRLSVDGVLAPLVAAQSINSYAIRYFFKSSATSGTVFAISPRLETFSAPEFDFYSLQQTDIPVPSGTSRQKTQVIAVAGSARTEGALEVSHPTSALGTTLIYTWPPSEIAYTPPLRPYRTSGGTTTADSTLVSGARDNIDTPLVFQVPVANLIEGTHYLMARLRSDTNGQQTVNWSAQLVMGSTPVGTAMSGSRGVSFGTSPATWRILPISRLLLPPTGGAANSSALVQITLSAANPSASNIDVDDAYLFNSTVGACTQVECGTGDPASSPAYSNRVWLETATTDRPRPAIFRGHAADQSDAYYANSDIGSWGTHSFLPSMMSVFTVTSNALDAVAQITHTPRWYFNAGQ